MLDVAVALGSVLLVAWTLRDALQDGDESGIDSVVVTASTVAFYVSVAGLIAVLTVVAGRFVRYRGRR